MAADILAYRATHVPVGDDQKQHLELARDIAQKFNNDFSREIVAAGFADGIFFPLPEPVITGPATRVMSLRDGTKKMSKSDPSDLSRINLTDDADTIAKKIQKAKTDPEPLPDRREGPRRAARRPTISSASTRRWPSSPKRECSGDFGGQQFSAFKKALAEVARREARAHRRRDAAADGRSRPKSTAFWPTAPARARGDRRPDHGRGQGHRRLHPLSLKRSTAATSVRRCRRPKPHGSMGGP